jgi:hypothetical protein
MLAFICGFIACWLCGGIYTAYLAHVHDKVTATTTKPTLVEIATTVILWPVLWYCVAREDMDDFWSDEVKDWFE